MTIAFDRRIVPAREDLAAEHLRGVVAAPRYVPGVARRVVETSVPLRRVPDPTAAFDTEAIYGEVVTVYDEIEGWAWGQLARDGYVGWLSANALRAPVEATHRVCAVRTFIYPTPSIKTPAFDGADARQPRRGVRRGRAVPCRPRRRLRLRAPSRAPRGDRERSRLGGRALP